MANISSIEVIHWTDLNHSRIWDEEMEGFHKFSYGDAEHTLVSPAMLISEINRANNRSMDPLVRELSEIPPTILIAFEG